MINKLKQDYEDLTCKFSDLRLQIAQLNTFLKRQDKIYSRKESIDALNKIRKFLEIKGDEEVQIQNELELLRRQIDELCSHRVIIKYGSNLVCPVCSEQFYVIADSTIYEVETDNSKDFNTIIKLFEENSNESSLVDENILEEIQYSYDVKVRRLKNEKKGNYRNA